MSKQSSKIRLVAIAVGLAIVVSSCGIQNQAGNSSPAPAGKTKNAALTSEWCYVTGESVNIYAPFEYYDSIRWLADRSYYDGPGSRNRFMWVDGMTRITDVYGPDIVKCATLVPIDVAAAGGATSAEELPPAFVENSTANQCITIENRKKTLQGYDEQIMAHSLDADKTIYEQMKTGRWVTTLQRPCDEASYTSDFYSLACVSVSHKAFEQAFWDEQYELHKEEAGTPYLDTIIINREKVSGLATC